MRSWEARWRGRPRRRVARPFGRAGGGGIGPATGVGPRGPWRPVMTTQTRQPRRSLQPAIRRCSHPGLTDRAPSRSPAAVLGPAPQCRALRAPGWAGPPRTAPGDPPKHSSRPDRGFISSSPTPTLRRRARAAPRGTSPPTHRGRRGAAVNGGVAALGAGPGAQRAASLQPHYLDDRRHRPSVMGVPPSTTCRCCRSGPGVATSPASACERAALAHGLHT
jgi:hypothetical protein